MTTIFLMLRSRDSGVMKDNGERIGEFKKTDQAMSWIPDQVRDDPAFMHRGSFETVIADLTGHPTTIKISLLRTASKIL